MIATGRCPNSNSIQFFNPANGTFVSSVDYKFQYNVTSGAYFGMKYQPSTFIYRLDKLTTVFTPKFPIDLTVHVHTHSPPSTATIIGLPSYDAPNVYTVSFRDGSVSEYTDNLLSLVPDHNLPTQPSLLPSWIQGDVNATLFLRNMPKPKHGTFQNNDNIWTFHPGKQVTSNGIILENFEANCQDLLDSGQLFRGHAKFRKSTMLGIKVVYMTAFCAMCLLMD
jgi:hypothetical protein